MDIRTLRYCVLLSEELNFTRVAEQAHITQQTLSHQIIGLERELGYLLFNRNNRSVEVTPAGKAFISIISNALSLIDKAVDSGNEFSAGNRGILSVAYTGPYEQSLIINAMKKYNDEHPDIIIDIRSELYENAIELLNNNILDLICASHFNKLTFSERYTARRIPSGSYKVLLSNKHSLACNEFISKEELLSETLILVDHKKNDIVQSSLLNDVRNLLEDLPKKITYARDISSVFSMIEAGMGYTFSPSYYETSFKHYNLIFKNIEASKKTYSQFVWLKENNSPHINDFINFAI